MTREILIEKLQENKTPTKDLIRMVECLPAPPLRPIDNVFKKGDVLIHKIFMHPVVILRVKKDSYVCAMMTSKSLEVTIPTNSRFYGGKYISKMLIEVSKTDMNTYTFRGVYDNSKHLTEIHSYLLNSLK